MALFLALWALAVELEFVSVHLRGFIRIFALNFRAHFLRKFVAKVT